MNKVIQSTLKTLQQSKALLLKLTNDELINTTVAPYYSSIGSHIRHILDFYDCALNIDLNNKIDLTGRKRNTDVENDCEVALEYLNLISNKLGAIDDGIKGTIIVIDDLGLGKIEMNYTFDALISQANSHTIHHYAIINYILERLNIHVDDDNFGYNPTTPKKIVLQ